MTRSDLSNRNPLEEFSTDMERVFDSLLGRTIGNVLRTNGASNEKFVPAIDVSETEQNYEVHLDLPGVLPADVKVEVHDGKLIVSGHRKNVTEQKDKNFHRVERSSGTFYRTVALPTEIDSEKIEASYDHGVLHVVLPKHAKQQPRKIEIRTGQTK
ncbi:MAG: Hsp20/alpha crystallin family protein [Planctomycetales bacterium]|nr:Hsp20/alpha crystallin family protein [Planctomycetales bacterium]